jgi:hypothetical protein
MTKFQHDCDKCKFLGEFTYQAPLLDDKFVETTTDLYHCGDCDALFGGSVIARFSDRDSDYASAPVKIIILK